MLFIILFQFLQANTQNNIQITDDGYQEIDVFQHERNKTYYSQTQTINCSYFYIQIDIQSFNVKTEVLLLTKNKIAPYFDNKKQINSDQMDMNSNLLNKNYRHLLLKTVSDTYITILINRPLKYNLTITPSNDLMCPKNCFKNGICYNAICQCHSGFIDEDCSQPAQEIFTDTQVTITNPQYLYVLQLNQSNLWKLTASTTNPLGIMIYFLYRIQKISIPTPQIYDDFKQINQQDSVMLNVDTNNQNKLILLIEQLGNKQDFEITIIIQKYKIEKEDSLVEYTMYGLGSLVILVVFLLLVRYILKKLNDKRQYELRLQSIKIVNIYEIPENSQEECTICKSQFDAQSLIRRTICKYELQKFSHFFHSSCLLEWLKYNNTCPMCRKQGIF